MSRPSYSKKKKVNPWLIHVNVWQKALQYCKVISLQLIKINEKKTDIKKHCIEVLDLKKLRAVCVHMIISLYVCVLSHTWLFATMGDSLPGFSDNGISQARMCHFLHQGMFPIKGSNPGRLCLLHWRADSLPMCHLCMTVSVYRDMCNNHMTCIYIWYNWH